jgi:hypothetical protein
MILALGLVGAPKGQVHDGFVPYVWDEAAGKIWLEAARPGQEFLYVTSLPAGIGSNDIGLDRGQPGHTHLVRWERSGNKVLLVAVNTRYRANSGDDAERRAVRDSFAESVLWGFEASVDGARIFIDATQFFLRDAHGVAETLQRAKQGAYRPDASRSAFYLPRTKNFPKNTEVETTVTPTGDAVTVRMHHSFVELPGPGFEPREFDPRAGYFPMSYYGERDALLAAAHKQGLVFLSDEDARPPGSAHPQTHLWDNGSNAVDELARFMGVRAKALERFGENNIRPGTALAQLEDLLVPLYLGHRYQVEAAVKVVGGLDYRYALRGDGQVPAAFVAPAEQRRALDAVLATLKPEALTLPERILKLIPPRPAGIASTRELFPGRTGLTLDPVAAAESAAGIVLELLLNSERAARLVQHHARNAAQPALDEVLDRLWAATWKAPPAAGLAGEVQRAVQLPALRHTMALAVDESAAGQARAIALAKVSEWKLWLNVQPKTAQKAFALAQIAAFEKDPAQMKLPKAQEPPPGMPIGALDECDWR